MISFLTILLLWFLKNAEAKECSFNTKFNIGHCENLILSGQITSTKSELNEINHLDIVNCSGSLTEDSFKSLQNLKSLYISDTNLLTISLTNLPYLRTLFIKNSTLPKLSKSAISGNLNKIVFENNEFEIAPESFQYLENLTELEIEKQNISLSKSFLEGLKKLETLELANVNIKYIPKDSFTETNELRTLTLDKNPIHDIKVGTFTELKKLKHLSLLDTELQQIDLELLKPLKELENLLIPSRLLKNIDVKKFLDYCESLAMLEFKEEDCGKPEIDRFINETDKLDIKVSIFFGNVYNPHNNDC